MRALISAIILYATAFSLHANDPAILHVVTEDLWPYNYLEDGEIKGSNTNLIKVLLDSMDIDYHISVLPWARSYRIAQRKPNTLIYTIHRSEQREHMFHWIGQFPVKIDMDFYALKSANIKPMPLSELSKLRIGTQIGTTSEQFLRQHNFTNITPVSRLRQTTGMLLLGRIDLIIASQEQIKKVLADHGQALDRLTNIQHAFSIKPSFAMSLGSSPELLKQLRGAYSQLQRKQDICKIMKIEKKDCTQDPLQQLMLKSHEHQYPLSPPK